MFDRGGVLDAGGWLRLEPLDAFGCRRRLRTQLVELRDDLPASLRRRGGQDADEVAKLADDRLEAGTCLGEVPVEFSQPDLRVAQRSERVVDTPPLRSCPLPSR